MGSSQEELELLWIWGSQALEKKNWKEMLYVVLLTLYFVSTCHLTKSEFQRWDSYGHPRRIIKPPKRQKRSISGSSWFLCSNIYFRRQRGIIYISKCGLWTSSIGITCDFIRSAESQLPFHTYWIRTCIWPGFQVIAMHINVLGNENMM